MTSLRSATLFSPKDNQDVLEYTHDVAMALLFKKVFVLSDKKLENAFSKMNSNHIVTMEMWSGALGSHLEFWYLWHF